MLLDYYALNSGLEQALKWLLRLASVSTETLTLPGGFPLSAIPNISFGAAFAQWLLAKREKRFSRGSEKLDKCGIELSASTSASLFASADELLISAITKFPRVAQEIIRSAVGNTEPSNMEDNAGFGGRSTPAFASNAQLLKHPLFQDDPMIRESKGGHGAETLERLIRL